MDSELENEKFSSLYLEQILSNHEDLDALIRGNEKVSIIVDDLVKRVADNKLEQQALLRDMFRLVSREGASQIADIADAVFTLFRAPALDNIFVKQKAYLLQQYLESVKKLTKDSGLYESIDKLLEIGKIISPYESKKSSMRIGRVWAVVQMQFLDPNDQAHIYSGMGDILSNLSTRPKRVSKRRSASGNAGAIELRSDQNVSRDEILQAVRDNPGLNIEEVALDVLGIMPWRVRRALKKLKDEGVIEPRKPGPVTPPDRNIKDEEVLRAILENPKMKYSDIARKVLKIDQGKFYDAAHRLRLAGKLEAKVEKKKKDDQPKS